jgi:hypothetical protein
LMKVFSLIKFWRRYLRPWNHSKMAPSAELVSS